MQFTYLAALLLSLAGLAVLDYRYKLAFWANLRTAGATLISAVAVFLIWDALGIALDIFKHGSSRYMLEHTIVSEFPAEELFFLALLVYVTLLLWRGSERIWPRT